MLSGYLTCNAKALDSNTNIVQSPAASDKIDESVLSDEKTVQSKINKNTKKENIGSFKNAGALRLFWSA